MQRILVLMIVFEVLCLGQKVDYIRQLINKPELDQREFVWERTNGSGLVGNLGTIGVNTLTFTPCPAGVIGNATGYWVRIYSGTGTPEVAKVIGGTCSATAGNGTLIIQTVNVHTGTWRVASSFAGISEANNLICTTGGTIKVSPGIHSIYALFQICSGVHLKGSGKDKTIFYVPNGEFVKGERWNAGYGGPDGPIFVLSTKTFPPVPPDIHQTLGASDWIMSGFTIDGNGPNQSDLTGAAFILGPVHPANALMEDIKIHNFKHTAGGAGVGLIGPLSKNNVVRRMELIGDSTKAIGQCMGGFFSQGPDNVFIENKTSFMCDDGFVASGYRAKRNKFIGNTAIAHAGNVGFHCESAYDCEFTANTAVGKWQGCYVADDPFSEGIGNAIFTNNICKPHVVDFPSLDVSQGIPESGFAITGSVTDTTIKGATHIVSNNIVESCSGRGVSMGSSQAYRLIIEGNIIKGCVIGIDFHSAEGQVPHHVLINGNIIDHNITSGINIQSDGTSSPLNNFIISNNFSGDTLTPAVQPYGLIFITNSNPAINNAIIVNNNFTGNTTQSIAGLNDTSIREGIVANNVLSGVDAGFSMYYDSTGAGLSLGKKDVATPAYISVRTSGNLNVVDSRITFSAGTTTPLTGHVSMSANALFLDGGAGIFVPKAYTYTQLTTTVPHLVGGMVMCTDCTAGPVCTGGGGYRVAISNGSQWTCN